MDLNLVAGHYIALWTKIFSLLEHHVIVGDLLTAKQMSDIENLKLPNVELQSDWTSDDIFIFLNDYLDRIGMKNLQPRIQIRRVFYRRIGVTKRLATK